MAAVFLALLLWMATASAVTPDEIATRLAEIESLRSMRAARGAPRVDESTFRKAADGVIVTGLQRVDGSPMSKAYGTAVLDVAIGVLWAAINDETRHPGYTAVDYAELIAGRPCQSGRKVLQSISVPVIGDKWWIGMPRPNTELMRYSGGSVRELAFSSSVDPALVTTASGHKILEAASPIGSSVGAWFLVALDQRHTYVEYFVHTDPGQPVPGFIASSAASKGVRNTITAMRQFALEGRPSCPIE